MSRIFYLFGNNPCSGGDFVNLDHVRTLRKWGIDAQILFSDENKPYDKFDNLPISHSSSFIPKKDDLFVFPECSPALIRKYQHSKLNCIMHCQNPFLMYYGFNQAQDVNSHPIKAIIVPSEYTARRLKETGVIKPIHIVKPFIPDIFNANKKFTPNNTIPKVINIAYSSRKRQDESDILIYYFRSIYRYAIPINFINIIGKTRQEVAEIMYKSPIFASFAERESLGLMALEAMTSGCHVVGFSGYSGHYNEYINDRNGDWVNEGDYLGFANKLVEAIKLYIEGEISPKVLVGMKTVQKYFRQEHFESDLKKAYEAIL